MKYGEGLKQLLVKTMVFLIVFIGVSFVIGQRIVSSSLLYGFNIFIYGWMGYVLLFSIMGFIWDLASKVSGRNCWPRKGSTHSAISARAR